MQLFGKALRRLCVGVGYCSVYIVVVIITITNDDTNEQQQQKKQKKRPRNFEVCSKSNNEKNVHLW